MQKCRSDFDRDFAGISDLLTKWNTGSIWTWANLPECVRSLLAIMGWGLNIKSSIVHTGLA